MPSRPTRLKRRLGSRLRAARETAGVTQADASDELHTEATTVSRYESGQNRLPWTSLAVLMDLYKVGDDDRKVLQELWEDASRPTPQVRLPTGTPDIVRELVRAEREASRALEVAPTVVPVLLQTPDYARAVLLAVDPDMRMRHVDEFVAARMDRQQLLTDGHPLVEYHAILDEAVLRRAVGGSEAMSAQLARILDVATRPNVTVQVIPVAAGAYGMMTGPCSIFVYDDPTDSIAYLDHLAGGNWVTDDADTRRLLGMFDALSKQALSPAESLDVIIKMKSDRFFTL